MNEEDRCPGTNRNGEQCGHPQAWGVPEKDEGPCKFHGGASSGPPKGSANALTHGATGDPLNLRENVDDEAREWIETFAAKLLARTPYDEGSPEADVLLNAATVHYQERAARGELLRAGPGREKVVGVTEAGTPIKDEVEHYLNTVASRHNTDFRMTLKDMGLLDDPESQKATATESIAAILADANSAGDA